MAIDTIYGWVGVGTPPREGGEYNVIYDLEDGGEPVVTTMDYYIPLPRNDDKKEGWYDVRGVGDKCETVLYWKDLPSVPPQILSQWRSLKIRRHIHGK